MFRKIIFVSDYFVDEFVGGAELSLQTLIDTCPIEYEKINSKLISPELIDKHKNCFWVFGNFSKMKYGLSTRISETLHYAILEFDYKYCAYRSPDLHATIEGMDCNCRNYFLDAFFLNAKSLFWMSRRQRSWYEARIKDLSDVKNSFVISSLFSDDTLRKIEELSRNIERKGWAVIHSNSVIKGFEQTVQYCIDNKLDYRVLRNLKYAELLTELSKAEGFVYMPVGGDTCPRTVIEAKLLGCKLKINDFVEHKDESWFDCDVNLTKWHLERNKHNFWKEVLSDVKETVNL